MTTWGASGKESDVNISQAQHFNIITERVFHTQDSLKPEESLISAVSVEWEESDIIMPRTSTAHSTLFSA